MNIVAADACLAKARRKHLSPRLLSPKEVSADDLSAVPAQAQRRRLRGSGVPRAKMSFWKSLPDPTAIELSPFKVGRAEAEPIRGRRLSGTLRPTRYAALIQWQCSMD